MGYVSTKLIKDEETQTATLSKPRVLLTDGKITLMSDVIKILEKLVSTKEPLLIIAPDVSQEALSRATHGATATPCASP